MKSATLKLAETIELRIGEKVNHHNVGNNTA
jgi:hypothetical protein